jgi:ribosomal protein S18 acetylase RimI-like enzyme
MPVQIKKISENDLAAVAVAHLRAFPASALTALGPEAVRRYYLWQLTGPHDVIALGAWRDGMLAGFCFGGIFRGALGGFLRANRRFLIFRVLTHPWLLTNQIFRDRLATGVKILRRMRKHPAPTAPPPTLAVRSFGILSIAVDPATQGSGVGRCLLEAAEQHARQHGFAQMGLTVHPGNTQAVGFYERMGWERVIAAEEWRGAMRKRLETPPVDLVAL